MNDQELLFKGMQLCDKHQKKNGECKGSCPLINNMCITRKGNLIFKDELPDIRGTAGINFVEFTKQFRKMVEVLSEGEE